VSVEMLELAPAKTERIVGRAAHAVEVFTVSLWQDGQMMHGRIATERRP
jgi:hypothetical protein